MGETFWSKCEHSFEPGSGDKETGQSKARDRQVRMTERKVNSERTSWSQHWEGIQFLEPAGLEAPARKVYGGNVLWTTVKRDGTGARGRGTLHHLGASQCRGGRRSLRRKSSLRNTHRKEGLSVGIRHHQENGGKKKCRGRLQIKKAPESRTPRGRGQRRQEGAVSRGEESMSNALGMLSELKERNISFQEERETYRRGLTREGIQADKELQAVNQLIHLAVQLELTWHCRAIIFQPKKKERKKRNTHGI